MLDVEAGEIQPLYEIVCATMPYESGKILEMLMRIRARMEKSLRLGNGMYLSAYQLEIIASMKEKMDTQR
ncbi:hypothetical protein ACXIT0_12130 [Methylorubrum extorquens]